jgi:MFS family permease
MSITSQSDRPTPSRHFYGWRLLGFLWALYFLNMGVPLYGGAVINTYMLREIAMPRSIYGLGFALESFFLGILSVAVAASIHRWGIRVTFSLGAAFLLLGSVWMALFATRPWQYLVGFGLLVGTGASFSTIVPVTTTITRWFRRYRGRAMAIVMTASGTAGFITAPLMNKLMVRTGGNWRLAWWIIAAVAVVAVLLAWLGIREHPEDLGQLPDGSHRGEVLANPSAHRHETHWTLGEAARHLSFWMLLICTVGCHWPFNFFTAHWLLHLTGLGIRPASAALAMGFFTVGIMSGSLLGGVLADKLPARFACMTGLSFYAISSFLAIRLSAGTLPLAFLTALIYGMGFGCTFVCLNTVVGNFFGSKSYARINGTMFLLSTIVCTFSAFLGGRIFDVWKSYNLAFALNILIALVGICALSLAHPPVHEKERVHAGA